MPPVSRLHVMHSENSRVLQASTCSMRTPCNRRNPIMLSCHCMQSIPTPEPDPANVEFVLFVRNKTVSSLRQSVPALAHVSDVAFSLELPTDAATKPMCSMYSCRGGSHSAS